ncbi:MAG: GRP family sugar transporter [Bryobacterales bacterium]|nr:GRP family sugar transporter [Bryobacteraceae bacterium]MDW8129975.1 GRP family sugar transporter [Bryobacterales bacterium]
MVLPDTYAAALLLTILSMLCWGSWANTYKLAGKWRFELYYFDYALGVLVAAVVAAFTFGTLGYDGFLFVDDLMRAGKRNMAYGFAGGVVFNLANMLLVAAIAVAGLAVAFPVGIGLALVIGVIWNYAINPQANPKLLFAGVAVVVAAIVVDALAYRTHALERAHEQARAGAKGSAVSRASWKGIALSLASGVLMGSFYPLVELGKQGDWGLGPYAIAFVFALGVFGSTFVFNLFFMNVPVEGEPVEILDYFKGSRKQHLLGLTGGIVWAVGTISNFVAASAPREVQVGPAVSYAMGQGATLISALWGLLVWKEFRGATRRVKVLLGLMLVLFGIGLTLVAIAPLRVQP